MADKKLIQHEFDKFTSDSKVRVIEPDITLTDTISGLNDTAEMDLHGMGSCLCQVSGTWTGKVEFQGAIDGVWNTLSIFQPTGAITRNGIQNDNQNGLYRIVITAGYTKIRAILTSWSAGSVGILFNASAPVGSNQVWQLNAANLNATVTPATSSTFVTDTRFNTNHVDDATTTNVAYIGMEDAGGTWCIKKIDSSSTFPVFTYATVTNNSGLTSYTTAWAARTSATYGTYSVAF